MQHAYVVSKKILSKEANQKTVGSDDHLWFSTKTIFRSMKGALLPNLNLFDGGFGEDLKLKS